MSYSDNRLGQFKTSWSSRPNPEDQINKTNSDDRIFDQRTKKAKNQIQWESE